LTDDDVNSGIMSPQHGALSVCGSIITIM